MIPISLRSAETEVTYGKAKQLGATVPLESITPLLEWTYWKLIPNDFPYDLAYQISHMLLTKEAAPDWDDLSAEAKEEYYDIRREYLKPQYSQIIENCPALRSYPTRFHLHAVKFYDNRQGMKS